jgi:hypothetical protein
VAVLIVDVLLIGQQSRPANVDDAEGVGDVALGRLQNGELARSIANLSSKGIASMSLKLTSSAICRPRALVEVSSPSPVPMSPSNT